MAVAPAQLLNATMGPVGMLILTAKPRINLYNTIDLLRVNSLFCFVSVPCEGQFGGIVGTGIAQLIAIIGIKALFLFQVHHYLKRQFFSFGYLKAIIAGSLSAGIMFGMMRITG